MPTKMTAISLQEPWGSMIASGEKTIETRTWRTDYRGILLICCSRKSQDGVKRDTDGKAIAIVELLDCRPMQPADARAACFRWEPDRIAWVIRLIKAFAPAERFDVSGALGLFERDVPPELLESVTAGA